jgi:hypothetical protein
MKKSLIALSLLFLFSACEEEYDTSLESAEAQLVVEAELLENRFAQVKLSKSTDYFSSEPIPVVNDAQVSLVNLNNGSRELLQNQGEGRYIGNTIKGEAGESYRLEIDYSGTLYQATSTLYSPVEITDITFNAFSGGNPFGGQGPTDGYLVLSSFESVGKDVYYRLEYELEDTTVADGYYLADAGPKGQVLRFGTPQVIVEKSERFRIRIRSIDRATYTYFNGLASLSGSGFGGGPGGSATPFNPISNFEPSILGYFAASSYSQLDTIAPN